MVTFVTGGFFLPFLTGQMLADVVLHKGVSAGSLDGWGWRELKALPVSWFDERCLYCHDSQD